MTGGEGQDLQRLQGEKPRRRYWMSKVVVIFFFFFFEGTASTKLYILQEG